MSTPHDKLKAAQVEMRQAKYHGSRQRIQRAKKALEQAQAEVKTAEAFPFDMPEKSLDEKLGIRQEAKYDSVESRQAAPVTRADTAETAPIKAPGSTVAPIGEDDFIAAASGQIMPAPPNSSTPAPAPDTSAVATGEITITDAPPARKPEPDPKPELPPGAYWDGQRYVTPNEPDWSVSGYEDATGTPWDAPAAVADNAAATADAGVDVKPEPEPELERKAAVARKAAAAKKPSKPKKAAAKKSSKKTGGGAKKKPKKKS